MARSRSHSRSQGDPAGAVQRRARRREQEQEAAGRRVCQHMAHDDLVSTPHAQIYICVLFQFSIFVHTPRTCIYLNFQYIIFIIIIFYIYQYKHKNYNNNIIAFNLQVQATNKAGLPTTRTSYTLLHCVHGYRNVYHTISHITTRDTNHHTTRPFTALHSEHGEAWALQQLSSSSPPRSNNRPVRHPQTQKMHPQPHEKKCTCTSGGAWWPSPARTLCAHHALTPIDA